MKKLTQGLKTLLFSALCLLTINLTAQESRDVSGFTKISTSGGVHVELTHGNSESLTYEMIKGESENLITEVKGGTLHIKLTKKKGLLNWGGSSNLKANVWLTYKDLEGISTSAGSKVTSEDKVEAGSFDIDASSGSRVAISLASNETDVDVSSGASVRLDGKGTSLNVDVSSGASFKGDEYECDKVDADASSGASAKVWANKSITAGASSGGSVKYKGNPSNKDIDVGKYSGGSVSGYK